MRRIFPIRVAAAAGLIFMMAGEAHAQQRDATSAQVIFSAVMGAVANRTSVRQDGAGNGAAIVQNGQGNIAGIRQYGSNNTGAITQDGDNNAACLIQVGRNLDGSITQTGDYNSAGVIQTRRGTTEIPAELCSMQQGNGRGIFMSAARHAVGRAALQRRR